MKFSICLIEPEGYKYSHFLYDVCKYFCYTIEATGYECCMVKNKFYSDRINIILGSHSLIDPSLAEQIKRAGKYIIVQSEVLREGGISGWPNQKSFYSIYVPLMQQAFAVWDGIESNIPHLTHLGIHTEQIPLFGYLPKLEEVIHKKQKDIDFLHYGSLTPHRLTMIEALKKRGGNVVCIFDEAAIFRNDYIARTRVNLAPIQAPEKNSLTSRILFLLNNRSIVVVERCHNQGWVEHCFLSADAENWAELCMETLHRPHLDQLADEYFENYQKLDMTDLFQPLLDKLLVDQYVTSNKESSINTKRQKLSENDVNTATPFLPCIKEKTIPGLTSIIIFTHNRLEQTKKCVKSIRNHTREPYEIIFVDNGSTDGTLNWLYCQVKENKNYRLIENKKNVGLAKGRNQGINLSQGEFILLLDNDVVVSEGWLFGLLDCLNHSPAAGIIGPMTNNISGPQQVNSDEYRSADDLDKYASKFRKQYRHRRIPLRKIVGFCMLFRRALAEQIGMLDESFGTGNFEDDDFCLRAALAGYKNHIAGDVFIHHYGSKSFIGSKINYSSPMSGNIKIFEEKWTGLDLTTPLGKEVGVLNAINKAETLYQKGGLDRAIAVLIEGIRYAPDEKALYYHLAEMLLDNKRYNDALEAIHSIPPEAKHDLKRLEIVAYCTEDLKEAAQYADQILEKDKTNATALNLKGIIAHKQGDDGTAKDFFLQAIASDPGYGESYTNRGMLKWALDQREEALDLLEKGFILSPVPTDNVTLYHSAITELEQFARAEGLVRDAKALHPENKRILFFLIDILIKQGKFDMAMDEIEKAMLDIGIDDGMLAAALEIRNKVGIKEIDKVAKNTGILSLCMIVKNEEQHLARCLLSVKPAVDEMIIVDTGSTDRTKDIARVYGAKIFDFPWTNDFSIARNLSLSMASGDWILILDADEVISSLDYDALEKIVKKKPAKPVAYAMVTRNYTNEVAAQGWTANDRRYGMEEAGTGWFPSVKVRLFINDKRIRFENPVHEFVEASLEKTGIEIKTFDMPVHHYGRFDKDKLLAKGRKYFILGKQKIEEMNGDIKALKELAVQASELGEYKTGVQLWKKVIELDRNNAAAFLNISYAYLKLEKYQEALVSSRRALELQPTMKEAALNYAGSELIVGDINKTISVLETLLEKDPDYPPAMALVAAAYYMSGQKEAGLTLFEKLRKRKFDCAEFLDEQYRGVISQGKLDQAISLLDAAIKTGNISKDTYRLLTECQNKKDSQQN
jgi:GT2 family glycosyltransferase/tetratricopeptide (TPR) repeat protein